MEQRIKKKKKYIYNIIIMVLLIIILTLLRDDSLGWGIFASGLIFLGTNAVFDYYFDFPMTLGIMQPIKFEEDKLELRAIALVIAIGYQVSGVSIFYYQLSKLFTLE